jgi:hypothetical protein
MITCHRSNLEQRCAERGYTLDEVMPCVVSQDGDKWTIDVDHAAYPRSPKPGHEPPQPIGHGPGTELKKLLAGWPFYITSSPDCSCNRVAAEMDAWGADECERPERMAYIVAAMRENAARRGIPFVELAAKLLVRRAIRNARRAAQWHDAAPSTSPGSDGP